MLPTIYNPFLTKITQHRNRSDFFADVELYNLSNCFFFRCHAVIHFAMTAHVRGWRNAQGMI